jgi:hypothetical protein
MPGEPRVDGEDVDVEPPPHRLEEQLARTIVADLPALLVGLELAVKGEFVASVDRGARKYTATILPPKKSRTTPLSPAYAMPSSLRTVLRAPSAPTRKSAAMLLRSPVSTCSIMAATPCSDSRNEHSRHP